MFWPIFAQDVDGDSVCEIGALTTDSTIAIYEVNSDLSLTLSQTLNNFSPSLMYANEISFPHSVITDLNKNGKTELWFLDREGDIFSYELNSNNKFVPYFSVSTGFESLSNQIAVGDFDNDGAKELVVLVHSISEIDIASFNILEVFKLDNSVASSPKLNLIFSNAFVDPAEEFGSSFQKKQSSLKFVNIEGKDKLVLFTFPYSYILSNNGVNLSTDFIYFDETTNSNSIFTGYLSNTSNVDIAFPKSDKIKFLTSSFSNQNIPTDITGYSLDSSSIYLKWNGNSDCSVYRGSTYNTSTFIKIGSTNSNHFVDTTVNLNTRYYYIISNSSLTPQNYSTVVEVYHHKAAKVLEVKAVSALSLEIKFSEKVKTVVENLQVFSLLTTTGGVYPHSVSPSSSYSYLVTFSKELANGENKLVVKDLNDFYNSPIVTDTISFNFIEVPAKDKFYITAHSIITPYKINIQFNLPVDTNSVLNRNNYIVEPANPISSISLIDDRSIRIDFVNRIGSIGKEYKVICKNVLSNKTAGSLTIETGAGSEVILLAKTENLENVFVYPSPAKISNGVVTFANLPQYAEILIYSLSGNKINHIFETDGNGGLSWDFRDLNGDCVNTGVYLYMIKQLDNNKNEVNQKVGKLAIIK